MEVAAWNLRECSVRLWRCDRDGPGRAERTYRDVRAAPLDPRASTVPRVEHRIRTTCEASALDVELESDGKDVVVKQELAEEEYAYTWKNIKAEPDFTEVCSSVVIVKSEMDENIIKEELELGPVLLQSRTISSVDTSSLKTILADPRPSTDSVDGADLGQLCTRTSVLSGPASGRDAGEYCYEGGSGVLSDANIKLELKETDDPPQKVLRKQFCSSSNSQDTSAGTRELTGKPYKCNEHITMIETNLLNNINAQVSINPYRRKKSHKRILTHADEKPYKCEQCEYSTSYLCSLKRHMHTHTGKKPYQCEQCEYGTPDLGNLKRHMFSHTGEKPYKCKHCEYRARERSALKRHMYTHTGQKPYKCKHCEYSTAESRNLKRHMHTHTGEKPFECEQCEYSTYLRFHLKRHMVIHTKKKTVTM